MLMTATTAIITALLPAASAPPPCPAPDPASAFAAPRYLHLLSQYDADLRSIVREVDFSLDRFAVFERRIEPDQPPLSPREVRDALVAAAPLIEGFAAASRLPSSDLALDPFPDDRFEYGDPRYGIGSKFSDVYRLLRADAARAWADGDRATIWRHAATIIRMSTHLGAQSVSDPFTPAHAALLLELGCDLAAKALDSGALPDEAALRELREALAAIPADDPAGIRRCWSLIWRRNLDEARRTLESGSPERSATRYLAHARNNFVFSRQLAERLEDLPLVMDVPPPINFYERARAWIIWTYWPALYDAIDAGLIPALPRPFIEDRLANAEALCLQAEQAWTAGSPPDRITDITRAAGRDSTRLAALLTFGVPRQRSDDLALRARIDEFRARLDALPP